MASDISELIKFNELCMVFEATYSANNQTKIVALQEFIKKFKEKCQILKQVEPDACVSFYPILRLILPYLERERGPYGLREATFGKRLIKLLGLLPENNDVRQLLNYKSSDNTSGDFANVAYEVLRKYFLTSSELSIKEINLYLNAIAKSNSENSDVMSKMHELFAHTSPEEQKWLIRIILKDLKLGLGHNRILNIYHPDGTEFYSSNNSLSKVCDVLTDPSVRFHEIEISVFSPFRPMLSLRCEKVQLNNIFTTFTKMFVETKFDGERFQLHMNNDEFKYFSRNGFDYTNHYGENFSSGVFTPLLKNAFKPYVKNVILDGEMMGWDRINKQFGSKGMNYDVKFLNENSVHQPCFCVFDILFLNDRVLTNTILHERLSLLDSILTPIEGVIMISHRIEVTTKEEIVNCLNNSVDREEEGIVFKDPLSVYKANSRNCGWWKLKLEYFENVMNDLDVIVMGGYYGEGRNRNKISGFLVGVSVFTDDDNHIPSSYLSFAKIASGLSDDELKIIEENLGPHWKTFEDNDNPLNYGLLWNKETPDVWIPPNKSCILLVRGSELVKTHSSSFKMDYTLRFPRIKNIRLDKPYYDCLTLEELKVLISSSNNVQKLNKRHLDLCDLDMENEQRMKKRCIRPKIELKVKLLSSILKGYEFCVLTGTEEWEKSDIENYIRSHGGTVVRYEGDNTLCILVGDYHPRVKSCRVTNAPYDLVKLDWLKKIIKNRRIRLYAPKDTLHISPVTRQHFKNFYDKFGDSYTISNGIKTFSQLMDRAKQLFDCKQIYEHGYASFTLPEIEALFQSMSYTYPLNIFQDCIAYCNVPNYRVPQKSTFSYLGGTIVQQLNQVAEVIGNTNVPDLSEVFNIYEELKDKDVVVIHKSVINSKLSEFYSHLNRAAGFYFHIIDRYIHEMSKFVKSVVINTFGNFK